MAKLNKIKDLSELYIKTVRELKGECITQKEICETFNISRRTLLEIWKTKL